jgi:hypothetical protein
MKIQSDNSSQFLKEFEEMVEILRAENYKIQPYSHEENGMVERANKEIRRHMRALTHENRTREEWDTEYLKVQAILNEKVSESTGLKPNEVVFVGKVDLHAGRLYPRPTVQQRRRMSEFMQDQINMQEYLIEEMERVQDETDTKHLESAEMSDTPVLQVGQYIVARYEGGPKTKQMTRWHGPYRIITVTKRLQGRVYSLYNAQTEKEKDDHEAYTKQYVCSDDFGDYDALRVSVLDDDMYIVEKVIEHRYALTGKLELLVQWYGSKEAEWTEFTKAMNNNIVILKYFRSHDLEQMIPIQSKRKLDEEDIRKKKRVRFGTYKEQIGTPTATTEI